MSQYINLFDPALRPKRDYLSAGNVAFASLAALLLVAAGAGYASWQVQAATVANQTVEAELNAEKMALAEMNRALAARKPDTKLLAEVARVGDTIKAKREIANSLANAGFGESGTFAEAMRALARQPVPGLWLTSFTFGGSGLEIVGRTLSPELVPAYLQRLNAEASFRGRSFSMFEMRAADQLAASEKAPAVAVAKPAVVQPTASTSPPAHYLEFVLRSKIEGAAPVASSASEERKP